MKTCIAIAVATILTITTSNAWAIGELDLPEILSNPPQARSSFLAPQPMVIAPSTVTLRPVEIKSPTAKRAPSSSRRSVVEALTEAAKRPLLPETFDRKNTTGKPTLAERPNRDTFNFGPTGASQSPKNDGPELLSANTDSSVTPPLDQSEVDGSFTTQGVASPDSLTAKLAASPATESPSANAAPRQVRFDSDVPQLQVATVGPDTMVVGKADRYVITLTNYSDIPARDVSIRCDIPDWISVESHSVSAGEIQSGLAKLVWQIPSLVERGTHQLFLSLTPRAARPFDLNVNVGVKPKQGRRTISIQEPALQVAINGPEQITFGEQHEWNIVVANPGTGDANDVSLQLESGNRNLGTVQLDSIPAGAERTATLALSANETGVYQLSAIANGALGLSHQSDTEVLVKRGRLEVAVTGADFEYAGASTPYTVVVRNTGDAALQNVEASLNLPTGIAYTGGIEDAAQTQDGVQWTIGKMAVNEERVFKAQVQITTGGVHSVTAHATSADQQDRSAATVTESLTSADLRLEVFDAPGPRPVGQMDEYEIHVTNRGTATARDIRVVAVCAPEVEPIDVTGNAAIKSGQIFFRPIAEMAPDYKMVFKVRVKAKAPGTHALKVIVNCYEPELRLATEESASYFDRGGIREVITRRQKPSAVNNIQTTRKRSVQPQR